MRIVHRELHISLEQQVAIGERSRINLSILAFIGPPVATIIAPDIREEISDYFEFLAEGRPHFPNFLEQYEVKLYTEMILNAAETLMLGEEWRARHYRYRRRRNAYPRMSELAGVLMTEQGEGFANRMRRAQVHLDLS